MNTPQARAGYVLIVTLMIISICVIMTTALFHRIRVYTPFVTTALSRERAKAAAHSGLQIALSRLYLLGKKEEKEEKPVAAPQAGKPQAPPVRVNEQGQLFQKLYALLNQWNHVDLAEKTEGITGTIEYYITCEEGKTNLNVFYDFEKKKFAPIANKEQGMQKILQEWCAAFESVTGAKDVMGAMTTFLQKRSYAIAEVTQLCKIAPLGQFFKDRIFRSPAKKVKNESQPLLFLTDLFTVESKKSIDPWFFSPSMQTLLRFPVQDKSPEALLKMVGEVVAPKIEEWVQWDQQSWNRILAPLYQKNWENMDAFIKPLLKSSFGPRLFSVLSYGTVGTVTQGLYAIVELIPEKSKNEKYRFSVRIKKLYWV